MTVEEIQFGIMPEGRTIDTVFNMIRMQEEYHTKRKKLYMYFVDSKRDFDRVPRKMMEWEEMNTISLGKICDESV